MRGEGTVREVQREKRKGNKNEICSWLNGDVKGKGRVVLCHLFCGLVSVRTHPFY